MIIMGIDPGTAATGFGLIKKLPDKLKIIDYGCIKTETKFSTAERLKQIDQQLAKLIRKHKPKRIAVEDIFFFKNVKTVIKVSQARGVVLARAAQMEIPVVEDERGQEFQTRRYRRRGEKLRRKRPTNSEL